MVNFFALLAVVQYIYIYIYIFCYQLCPKYNLQEKIWLKCFPFPLLSTRPPHLLLLIWWHFQIIHICNVTLPQINLFCYLVVITSSLISYNLAIKQSLSSCVCFKISLQTITSCPNEPIGPLVHPFPFVGILVPLQVLLPTNTKFASHATYGF